MSDQTSSTFTVRAVRGGALDALRFLAAMFVVVFHFGDAAPVPLSSFHPVLTRGYLATDFFLILSGFVLAKAYGSSVLSRKITLGHFWLRRLVRCYPTHLITLGLLVAMVLAAGMLGMQPTNADKFAIQDLPAQIFLLHAFGQGGGQWNIPSWTISALLICYLFFPTLWRGMARIERPATALTLALLILVSADLASLAIFGTEQFQLPFKWSLFRAAPLFLVGLCLGATVRAASWRPLWVGVLGWSAGLLLLANAWLVGPDILSIIAICGIILGCGAGPTTRVLPMAAWGAKVSFCLFMIHTLTGAVWFDAVQPMATQLVPALAVPSAQWMLWTAALVATVVAAGLYCAWIDEPLVKWLNGRLFKSRQTDREPASIRPDRRQGPHQGTEPNESAHPLR
jgi:Predicted acyltransferases